MDYKKSYEDAIVSIKEVYNQADAATKAALEARFPELAESEDEKIRKYLIQLMRQKDQNVPMVQKAITYLEKQKEQKPTDSEKKFESIDNAFRRGREVGFHEGVESVKPAECLKPERDCWYVCIKDFYAGGKKQSSKGDLVQAKGGMYMMGREDISEWFRKAYYDEIKPAEWSEEDDMLIDELESYILYDKEFNDEQKSWRIKKLKSLRPQPHWKPSDEQMEALEAAFRKEGNDEYRRTINSLYQDLKKLCE